MGEPGIHPTAIIESGAQLAADVSVGAYAFIGARVMLGAGCVIHHHATVEGWTTLGPANEVFPYAYLGGRTQDKKWTGEEAPIHVGQGNIFREFCTVHPATFADRETRIGDHNLFSAYSHLAHESMVGSHCVFSNNATLGGHVTVEDYAVIGGLTGIHQHCRVGRYAMVGGCMRITQDVLPYMLVGGETAAHRGVNKVGLGRHCFSEADIALAQRIYKLLFRNGLNLSEAVDTLRTGEFAEQRIASKIAQFITESGRGILRSGDGKPGGDDGEW